MDLNFNQQKIVNYEDTEKRIRKRKISEETENPNETKTNADIINELTVGTFCKQNENGGVEKFQSKNQVQICGTPTKVPISPKKRLKLSEKVPLKPNKEKYIFGNYSQYYGYRNKYNDCHDNRLDVFDEHRDIFKNKDILDIGCNNGFITIEVAKKYDAKSIVGIDIDKSLINQAIKNLTALKKALPMDNELKKQHKFPFNTTFVHGNYVLKNDILLEIEKPQFDIILCLSITKWIHLNFGDKGLKQAFQRMFLQLKSDGKLILEAQSFENYSRRKKMTDTIYQNYKDMKLKPNQFTEYLLSSEVGFSKVELMGVPDHCSKGFQRPITIFFKSSDNIK